MKNSFIRTIAIITLMFTIAFTTLPMLGGGISVEAKSSKKIVVSASATGYTTVSLSWNKISRPGKGYAVFRDGYCIAHVGKSRSFGDSGLATGSYHTYQVKAYTTKVKKTKMWYNKATGQYQKKKPAKKNRGKAKTFKTTTYKYSKASNSVGVSTPAPTPTPQPTPTPTPTPDDTIQTKTITTTNYLGQTFTTTLYRKKSDPNRMYLLPSCTPSSEYTGVVRAEKDKNFDYTWERNGIKYIQKNGVTISILSSLEHDATAYLMPVYIYNGDPNKLKLDTQESVTSITTKNWDKQTITLKCIEKDGYRLVWISDAEAVSAGIAYKKFIPFLDYTEGIGFVSGDVHINVSYDYNNNGTISNDEKIGTQTYHVNKDPDREFALNICQTAVAQAGTNSYDADMFAISDYINANYKYGQKVAGSNHLKMECDDGEFILETWSIWKYGVYGYASYKQASNYSHGAFWPLNNPYSVHACFDAQGHY